MVELLGARFATRPAAAWSQTLAGVRVPAGPVNDIAEAFALAERLGLEPTVTLPVAGGTVRLARNPIRLSATPASYRLGPPMLDDGAAGWAT
jgi:crotonobetainyl-CoA:carnitine CoA-transferase CaiB-like acyl-CoA transferase